jgi:NADH-quinone oxidoreductase subunit M
VFPWLTILGLLPLIGGLAMIFVRGTAAKQIGLAFSLLTLVLSIIIAIVYVGDVNRQSVPAGVGPLLQLTEQVTWIKSIGAHYALGLDGIGLTLVLLTAFLTPMVLIASWNDPESAKPGEDASITNRWGAHVFVALILVSMLHLVLPQGLASGQGRGPTRIP